MLTIDPYVLVRAASLYIVAVLTAVVWVWRRPSTVAVRGAALGFVWNLSAILFVNVVAIRAGWWHFDAQGGLLFGIPVDLYLEWAWAWGGIPTLASTSASLIAVNVIALGADLLLMPAASPVVRLGPLWLVGEFVALSVALIPSQCLARWTARNERLSPRAVLQVVGFGGLMTVLVAVVIAGSRSSWSLPLDRPVWQLSLLGQLLAAPAVIGLTAVQEFVMRGGGTPVPFDPPRRLVTTGIYAYVRNPMQLSAVVLLALLGVVLRNPWVSAAGVMAHIYSSGLAGWDEEADLLQRFGAHWTAYRNDVRRWLPRIRPWFRPDQPEAVLFVSESCDMCREVSQWFRQRGAQRLTIVPAETHPSGALTRITYEPADGSRAAAGVEAIARALEHIHLGWAMASFFVRLPIVRGLTQLLADASGAEPRSVPIRH
jgi:protein-S-isoprenylcysteine O-methyltransferase Ste14